MMSASCFVKFWPATVTIPECCGFAPHCGQKGVFAGGGTIPPPPPPPLPPPPQPQAASATSRTPANKILPMRFMIIFLCGRIRNAPLEPRHQKSEQQYRCKSRYHCRLGPSILELMNLAELQRLVLIVTCAERESSGAQNDWLRVQQNAAAGTAIAAPAHHRTRS